MSTPQKANSITPSLASATSDSGLESPVKFVKGVGPRLGVIFGNRGIKTVRDLLFFFPRDYEDRSKLQTVSDTQAGAPATLKLTIVSARRINLRRGKSIFEVRAADESGTVSLKWFHSPKGLAERLEPGIQIFVSGTPKRYLSQLEFIHPEVNFDAGVSVDRDQGRIIPIYIEIEGVPTRTLRKILWAALERWGNLLQDEVAAELLTKHRLPKLAHAVREIHFPSSLENLTPARARLIYDEFLKFEFLILRQRLKMQKEDAVPFIAENMVGHLSALETCFPFQLTGDQRKAVQEVLKDLTHAYPMNRLIQGDVGSGKTAVAFLAAGCAIAEGSQVALMAPTEILAEQHFKTALKIFGSRIRLGYLTGNTPNSERTTLLARLDAGEPLLLIGTHALIEDPVKFKSLDLALIDEQHRFGVDQRRALRKKGRKHPHFLVLTATPIPRTLALTAYGDLAVSTLKEMPPGRTPIKTRVVRDAQKQKAYEFIAEQIKKGRQAYFIFPLVSDSEAEGFTDLRSAVSESARLQKEVFPEFKIGLLHGQMSGDEKNQIMDEFKRGKIQILVSTTVVEVGVDVPNATVMVVEHSERFGLSQLHQLRGRVGRGTHSSYCFLFCKERVGETALQRLETLERTTDGFEIAEADLRFRGPGEFLGTRQAGDLPFKIANLLTDQDWLLKAREDAVELLKTDPTLSDPAQSGFRTYFEREGKNQLDRFRTA